MAFQTDKNTARLGTERISRLLLDYSIPAVIGTVMTSLYNIVDRVFIGQGVGPIAISGLALTFPLMTLITAVGTLIGVGAMARISIVLGMKDEKWARNILGNAFFLTFALSVLLTCGSMLFIDKILYAFGGSEQTIPYARSYLMIVIPGSIFVNLSYSFSGIMRAAGYPQKSMYTILIGVVLNVILDPIFIFGFDMGIKGAAIATVISMFISSVFVMTHFCNPKHTVHFRRDCFRPKWRIIRNIVSIGMAPFAMNFAASIVNVIMNNQLVREGGDLAIGAFGIINSFGILIVMFVLGICQGMQPIVGYNYGAQKYKRMKDTFLLTIRISTLIITVGFIAFELMPGILVRAFTTDPELAKMAKDGMRLAYMVLPLIGIQIVTSVFFQSISKAAKATFMGLSRQVIFLIPALYFFSHWFGLTGVWLSLPCADLLSAIVALFMLRSERRIFYPRTVPRRTA
ncbi:MAG TPA: MATE family efflux transporter [Candidatus Alistipes merdigallinarum]|nr:MATE family efflux transporter [Candidatus Alistipes merdigallinarum]